MCRGLTAEEEDVVLDPGDVVLIDGGKVPHTILSARYDEEDQMAWYRLEEPLSDHEIDGSRITGVVTR